MTDFVVVWLCVVVLIGVVPFVCFSPQRCVCVGPGPPGVPDDHDEDGSTATGGEYTLPQKVLIYSIYV